MPRVSITTHSDPHTSKNDQQFGSQRTITSTSSNTTSDSKTEHNNSGNDYLKTQDNGNDKSQTHGNGNGMNSDQSGVISSDGFRCSSKRILGWRWVFVARDNTHSQAQVLAGFDKHNEAQQKGQDQNLGPLPGSTSSDNFSRNTSLFSSSSTSVTIKDSHNDNSHNDNSKYVVGSIEGQSGIDATASNGEGNSNNCFSTKCEVDEHEECLAVFRSLGAMTERDVEDHLEALAARDIGYAASMLGVRAYSGNDFNAGLARRYTGVLALRCVDGAECSPQMRNEAEELLTMHVRDLGFHF